jgi:hypothetical protein
VKWSSWREMTRLNVKGAWCCAPHLQCSHRHVAVLEQRVKRARKRKQLLRLLLEDGICWGCGDVRFIETAFLF